MSDTTREFFFSIAIVIVFIISASQGGRGRPKEGEGLWPIGRELPRGAVHVPALEGRKDARHGVARGARPVPQQLAEVARTAHHRVVHRDAGT